MSLSSYGARFLPRHLGQAGVSHTEKVVRSSKRHILNEPTLVVSIDADK